MPAKLTIQDAHDLAESRGFKFLSNEFKNTKTNHLWGCEKGHEWTMKYESIKQGRGCRHCSGLIKKTIEDAHKLAEIKGFKFLSTEYHNTRTKYLWECMKGHKWNAVYGSIQQDGGCPNCAGSIKKTISDAHNLAEKRGFKFLSLVFKNTATKYLWKCTKSHEWNAQYSSISQGIGCPHCAGVTPITKENAHNLAESRGYKFLSTEFKGVVNKYRWECSEGHEWNALYNHIKNGKGCPHCAGSIPKTISDAHNLAEKRGFKFLSLVFKNTATKYLWKCTKSHEWSAKYSDVQSGTGCPICCDNNRGEKITRYCFEKMLECDFKKIKPDWMRNPKTNYRLELDGFNQNMSLAFEHQGIHHEVDCPKDNRHYKSNQLFKDEIKRQKCKEQRITLIEVPEIGRRLKLKDVVPFLLSEFDKHNIAYPESAKSFQIDMREFYAEYMNEKSTTGVDDLLSELDAMDFSDDSLFVDSIMDELNNLDFDNPDLFN